MTRQAGETPRPMPTPAAAPSSLRHERIPRIAWRHEVLLHGPRRRPANQIQQAARLVVRTAGPPTTERLLSHDGSRRLVVEVEVAGGVSQRHTGFGERGAILCKDAARERVRRRAIHQTQRLLPLFIRIDVQREHGPENLFAHRPVRRVLDLDQGGMHEIAVGIIALTTKEDLGFGIVLRAIDVALDLVERFPVDHRRQEVAEIGGVTDVHVRQQAEHALAQLGPERLRHIGAGGGAAFLALVLERSAHDARGQRVDVGALATGIVRGAFEYQGQKCSAASRAYVPESLWPKLRERVLGLLTDVHVGDPADFRNFLAAVIDRKSFDKVKGYIDRAKHDPKAKILFGGECDDADGYFVHPTLIQVEDPTYRTMCEEIFGPVLSLYVYPDKQWKETLGLVDRTSPYALTGGVFAQDRAALTEASMALRYSAGNFYLNDKPTGAVVGQQPFGGGRASGTNDKAGSLLNLIRWTTARAVKENFVPPRDPWYPFMAEA